MLAATRTRGGGAERGTGQVAEAGPLGEGFVWLGGRCFVSGLDSVVVDSLDPYFEYGDPEEVITARNWVKPWLRMAQTSVFVLKSGRTATCWTICARIRK